MGSEAIAAVFSRQADGSGRLLRLLDNFTLHEPGRPHLLVPVEALRDRDTGTVVASGEVVQPAPTGPISQAGAGAGRVSVTTGPVLDWCLEYGDAGPAVWIITATAWYKLVQPSSQYSSTYSSVQSKADMCVRCRAALCSQPSAAVDAVQQSVLAGQRLGGSSSTCYSVQQLLDDVRFVAGQMKTLQQSGVFAQQGAPAGRIPFLDWLDYQAAYAAATAAAAEGAGADGPAAKRRRISEMSGTQGPPAPAAAGSGAAAPAPAAAPGGNAAAGAAGGFKLGSKLKIKFKSAQPPSEPPADRSSQIQGAAAAAARAAGATAAAAPAAAAAVPAVPAAVAAAPVPAGQLQRQPSAPSQMTAGTTGQSQNKIKTKLKFTLPKGTARLGAALGAIGAAGGAPAAAAAAPVVSPTAAAGAAAGGVQQGYGGAAYPVQDAHTASMPPWDAAAAYGQPAAPRQVQRVSVSGASRGTAAPSARAAAASSRAAEAAARKAAREREAQLKQEAESKADASRGPPPPPTRSSRLPAWAMGEVLTLWELCQCFAAALQLPSFPCEMLEAALLPGPLDVEERAATAAELAAAADAEAAAARAALAAATAAAAAVPAEQGVYAQGEAGKAEAAEASQQQQQQEQEPPQQQGVQPAGHVKQEPQSGQAQAAQQQQQQQEGGDAMQVDAPASGGLGPAPDPGTQQQQQPQPPPPPPQQQQPDIKQEQQLEQVKQEPQEQLAAGQPPPANNAADAVADAEAVAAAAAAAVKQEGEVAAGAAGSQQQQQQQLAEPAASGSTCTASVAPTASNSMSAALSPSGRSMKLKVKLGKVPLTPTSAAAAAAAAAAAGGVTGVTAAGAAAGDTAAAGAEGAVAAAGQQQQPTSTDPATAAAVGPQLGAGAGVNDTHPAADQQGTQQQQQQQGGTAWMAQAQAAALAAAAAVSTAVIEAADDADNAAAAHPTTPPQLQQQQFEAVGVTDAASLPSSLLLRDIHTGLIRLMDGSGPKPGKRGLKPPATARLCPTESHRQLQVLLSLPHWAHRAAQVVKQAGAVVTGPEAQEAAKQLLQSDYALLSLEPRLSLLRCLTDFAFVSELARSHLTARNDANAQARAMGKPGCSTNTFSNPLAAAGGPGGAGQLGAAAAAELATAVKMLEEWVEWVEMLSHQAALSTEPIPTIGLRRPLGVDHRRRRYWVLGGASGAWRVYCEEGDGSNWGYYEGQQLLDLTRWLAAAALESEGPLLARLCAIPWPYKPSLVVKAAKAAATAAAASAGVPEPQSPNSFSYWVGFAGGHPGSSTAAVGGPAGAANQAAGLTAVQAGVQPGGPLLQGLGLRLPHERQLMSSGDMRRRRPNGYASLVAPALYGEADIPGGAILSTTDERLRLGFDSLMSQVPFWLPGQAEVVRQLVAALEDLQGAHSPAGYTQALTHLELAMSSSSLEPHSPLEPDWHSTWKQAWRDSLTSCQPPSWEAVALHLSMMGRHVVPRPLSMSREAFFTTVEGSKCKLGFPAVGEVVCVVRSGCLLHLRHYAQLPDYATTPLPPPAAELNAAAEVVKTLPPVSKYKVVAVAYCQYPKPTPPPVLQQVEPAGSAQLGQASAGASGPQQQQQQQPGGGAAAMGVNGDHWQQQQQQQSLQAQGVGGGSKKGGKKRSRSKSLGSEWGLGYDDEDEFEGSGEEEEESESNSEDDEYNDRNVRLTGIDSDADMFGRQQQGSGSQPSQPSQQQQQSQLQANGTAAGQQPQQQQQQQPPQQQQPVVVQQRPPCMWVLLSPISPAGGPNANQAAKALPPQANAKPPTPSPPPGGLADADQLDDFFGDHLMQQQPDQQQRKQQKLPCLVVPLHIDSGLPDYLVQPVMYDASLQRRWLPQDRCSMYIGGRQRGGGPGAASAAEFAQGTIIEIEEHLPGEDYDPWQSITVLWDDEWSHLNLKSKVSPWDVDTDVEERWRQEEEAKKAAAAAAAAEELARHEAAAEAARQKRRQNQKARFDQIGDLGVAAAERDDDDDYNPEDDSSDSEGGRRGRKAARLAKQQAAAAAAVSSQAPWDPTLGELTMVRKRGRPPGSGRGGRGGAGPGLTWSGAGGRGGRGAASAIFAPPLGVAWTTEQVLQQQQLHLDTLQKAMAQAMASGNEPLLQQLKTGGIGGKVLPTPLPLVVLVDLPAELEFLILVAAYKNSQKPGFVPPNIGNRELDMYTLFMVVNVRGGYEAVCTAFRWDEVCKSLGCDSSTQTQTNMRIAYERALLEFEQYVRSGRYMADRAANQAPHWEQPDHAAAMEQCMRAGKVAAAAQSAPAARPAVGPRGALPLGAAGAAGLMALPGGLQGVQLMQGNTALAVQAQLAAQLRLQQQAQLLAAQKGAAGLRPGQAGAQPQAVNAMQQQLLQQQLLQRALLQSGGNPQLQALLLQQQQAQLAAAAAAGNARPLGTAAAPGSVLTLAQIQQLQQLQRVNAAGSVPRPAAGAAVQAGGAPAGQPAASQPLPSTSSGVNFSAMLGDV